MNEEEIDRKIERILAMTDEEVMAEHLRIYGGDKKLADRAIELQVARIQKVLADYWKQ